MLQLQWQWWDLGSRKDSTADERILSAVRECATVSIASGSRAAEVVAGEEWWDVWRVDNPN